MSRCSLTVVLGRVAEAYTRLSDTEPIFTAYGLAGAGGALNGRSHPVDLRTGDHVQCGDLNMDPVSPTSSGRLIQNHVFFLKRLAPTVNRQIGAHDE